jgi:hypothetical protein
VYICHMAIFCLAMSLAHLIGADESLPASHAEARGLNHQLEIPGTARGLDGPLVLDSILLYQLQQRLIEGLQVLVFALCDTLMDLARLRGKKDEILNTTGRDHDLASSTSRRWMPP